MPRYNHAFTIAFEVITDDPDGGTLEERLAGLKARMRTLETDPDEAAGALMCEGPYDTFEIED
jgi:hypothetical protein